YRDNGKVKQRTLADLGRKDLLVEILPKLQRFLSGDRSDTAEAEDPDFLDASTWGAGPRRPRPVRPTRAVDHPRRARKGQGCAVRRSGVRPDRQSAHPPRQRISPGRLAGDRLPLRSPGPPVRAALAPAQASPGPLPAARGLVPHPGPTRGRQGEDRGGPLSLPPRPVQLQAGPDAL